MALLLAPLGSLLLSCHLLDPRSRDLVGLVCAPNKMQQQQPGQEDAPPPDSPVQQHLSRLAIAGDSSSPSMLSLSHLQAQHSGMFATTPHGGSSIPGSPTAMSEYSITTHGSTSSAVPFSHIAQQRKQQEREAALQESAQTLLADAAAAFDLRMQVYTQDIAALQELNEAAAQQYSGTAEVAAALGQFVSDLAARQAAAKEALAVLPQLDRQLELLATAVSQLDRRSRQLEARLGLKPPSNSGGNSGSSTAYGYLASSVSQLTAVGVSTAAAAAGCLGGTSGSSSVPPPPPGGPSGAS
jgi:hypothetical protein